MAAIRLRTYAAISLFLTTILVANAANQFQQFYPTVVHLVSSKVSRIVLINDAILLVVLLGIGFKSLFFGTLRTYEEEKTWENAYVTLIETCLALTIFRGEMSSVIFTMFVSMLFLKIFHWIAQMRVQYIESLPTTSKMTFARLYSLMTILLAIDGIFSYVLVGHWLQNGPTVRVLFLTEYLVMCVKALSTTMRLNFHAYNLYKQRQQESLRRRQQEQRRQQNVGAAADEDDADDVEVSGWDNHNVSIFYLDIAADLLQSAIYIGFFIVIMTKYGLPIHLIRDIYMAIRSAKKRITDLINYRRLVSNLDQRFPDATPEELSGGPLCVVCREELRTNVKKLPCGHLFHSNCLRGWLEQTQECPTCRAPVDREAYDNYLRERNQMRPRSSSSNVNAVPEQPPQTSQTQPQQPQQPQTASATTYQELLSNYLREQQRVSSGSAQSSSQQAMPMNFNPYMMSMMGGGVFNQPNTVEQQQEMLLDGATRQNSAQKIMTNMYIQYLENSRKIIDSTLEQLRSIQHEE